MGISPSSPPQVTFPWTDIWEHIINHIALYISIYICYFSKSWLLLFEKVCRWRLSLVKFWNCLTLTREEIIWHSEGWGQFCGTTVKWLWFSPAPKAKFWSRLNEPHDSQIQHKTGQMRQSTTDVFGNTGPMPHLLNNLNTGSARLGFYYFYR